MRVVYLHQYFNTPEMSGSTRSFEIGRRLVASGHQVDVITSWREPIKQRGWFMTEAAGMRIHWLPTEYSNHMGYVARTVAFFKFALRASLLAARIPADIVYATSTPLTIAIPAVFAARRRRIPMVFEVRDLWPELPIAMGALKNPILRWSARALERFAYSNSATVVALSPGMAQGVVRAGYSSDRVEVVPNAADLDLFRRNEAEGLAFRASMGISPHKILIAYVGTFGRINGVAYLARLAAALRDDQRFIFVAVGAGLEFDKVVELARFENVLGKSFLMLPKIAKHRVPALLSATNVATSLFLPIPEMESNSANKFFDALAAGCCVAINYGGWHEQLLKEADAGIRLDQDPLRAADELRSLADVPGKISMAGNNARTLAERNFSRDELAMRIQAILSRAAERR